MSISDTSFSNYQPIERPWLWVGIFFILGIVAADKVNLPFFILYILCFIGLAVSLIGLRNKKVFFLSLLSILVVFGFLRLQIADIIQENNIGNYATEEKKPVILEGFIKSVPLKSKKIEFIFDVSYLIRNDRKIKTSGLVNVGVHDKNYENFKYGESYILEGLLYKPSPYYRFNYRERLKRKGIYALFRVSKNDGFVKLNQSKTNPILKAAYNLKNNLKNKYELLLPYPYNTLLTAFILGDRERIPDGIYDSFKHTGCIHILAISGLHVGMVIFIILALFKMLRVKRKPAAILCVIFLIFYCFLTGGRVSVIRASIMGSIILLGWALNRDSDIYNSLGLSAFCILLFNPYQLFDVGFQLSFVAVLSIVYLTPKVEKIFKSVFRFIGNIPSSLSQRKVLIYIFKASCISLCAWMGVMPLSLYYFNLASNMTVIANLFALPLLTIALALGFLVSIVNFLCLELASVFSQSLWLVLFGMVKITKILEKAPLAYFHYKGLSPLIIILYYFVLVGIFNYEKTMQYCRKFFERFKYYRQNFNFRLK